MPNESDNIQLGMSVDIKKAIQDITEFGKGTVKSVEEIVSQLDQRFKGEELGGPLVANLGEDFDGLNVSISELLIRLDELKEKYRDAAIGSVEQQRYGREIGVVEGKLREQRETLDRYTNSTNKSSLAVGRFSKYELRQLASQVLYNTDITGRLGGQLSSMATAFLTGGTIAGGFAAFAALLSLIGKNAKETAEEVAGIKKEVDDLIKVRETKGYFNVDPEKIDDAIALLKAERKEVEEFSAAWTKENENAIQLIILDEAIKKLEGARAEEEERLRIVNLIKDAGLAYTDETQKLKVEIEKLITTDGELLKQLGKIDEQLQLNYFSEREINLLLDARKKIMTDLLSDTKQLGVIIDTDIKEAVEDFNNQLEMLGDVDVYGPAQPPRELAGTPAENLEYRNQLLQHGLGLWNDTKIAAETAGRSIISSWAQAANILDRNNSELQKFINLLGKALREVLAVRVAMFLIDFATGNIGSIFGSSASGAGSSGTGNGGHFTKPLGMKDMGTNYNTYTSRVIKVVIENKPIEIKGMLENRSIRLAGELDAKLIERYG